MDKHIIIYGCMGIITDLILFEFAWESGKNVRTKQKNWLFKRTFVNKQQIENSLLGHWHMFQPHVVHTSCFWNSKCYAWLCFEWIESIEYMLRVYRFVLFWWGKLSQMFFVWRGQSSFSYLAHFCFQSICSERVLAIRLTNFFKHTHAFISQIIFNELNS